MKLRTRYEMETEFGIIEGTYEELMGKKYLFPNANIFEVVPSLMNPVRLSRIVTLTLSDYLEIHKLHKLGRSILYLREKYSCGDRLIMSVLKDEFNILQRGNTR